MNNVATFNALELRKALPGWLGGLSFTHFVTLAFNQKCSGNPEHILAYSRDKLKHFHARLDRKLLGKNWYKKSGADRSFFIAFPEKVTDNMHYHLLMKVPLRQEAIFIDNAESIWITTVPSGTYDCQTLRINPNLNGVASYVTKEQYKDLNFNHIVISSEFHKN